ncbi:hypothetical protein [Streptomyces sp. FXY-T5]|uniref:hypothetical protein n=1 Tax=Streptomyces sp. FXY-T5 TaxID=3064901 RepID=UPI0027D29797|nr:hypothetical protein [Streptomyces sp. FXY-T5]WMD08309.1 hypothetical protein Q7C01_29790 [Streptomyces sp. FXY-T5]
MHEDLRGGEAAAARLVQGMPLGEVLDVADPAAWTGLDLGVRTWGCCRTDILPDKAWVDGLGGASGTRGTWADGRWASGWRPEPVDPSSVEALLAVALCHPDGRTREAALARVADRPALLPLVVVRATDWVAPVRDRARDLLRAGLDARTGVALAPLILRIGRRERGAYGVELLGAMLRRAPRGALSSLFLHPDRTVRRFAYRLAVEESLALPRPVRPHRRLGRRRHRAGVVRRGGSGRRARGR